MQKTFPKTAIAAIAVFVMGMATMQMMSMLSVQSAAAQPTIKVHAFNFFRRGLASLMSKQKNSANQKEKYLTKDNVFRLLEKEQ
jgi:hypothetical protein